VVEELASPPWWRRFDRQKTISRLREIQGTSNIAAMGRGDDVQNHVRQHMTADEVLREIMGGSGRYVRSQSIHARVNAERRTAVTEG
jgi:hypothetical protein